MWGGGGVWFSWESFGRSGVGSGEGRVGIGSCGGRGWRRDGTKGAKGQTLEGIEAGNC